MAKLAKEVSSSQTVTVTLKWLVVFVTNNTS